MNTVFLLLTLTGPAAIDATPLTAVSVSLMCGGWGNLWPPAPACECRPPHFSTLFGRWRRRGSTDCGCCVSLDGPPPGVPPLPIGSASTEAVMPATPSLPNDGFRPLPTGTGAPILQEAIPTPY